MSLKPDQEMPNIKKVRSAFTFIELSIVVIIIGILIGSITYGSNSLLFSAHLNRARLFTAESPVPKISGLVAWYETSLKDSFNSAANNSVVTAWRDISPASIGISANNNTLTSGTNITYAKSGISKIPSLRFASTGRISVAALRQGTSTQLTIFVVFSPSLVPTTPTLTPIISSGPSNSLVVNFTSNAVNLNAGTSVGNALASFSVNSSYIVAAYFNGASSQVFLNNADTRIGGALATPGAGLLTGLSVGDTFTSAGVNSFVGLISEVIIYNRPLNLGERKDVMGYLSKKYRIAVVGV